MATTFATITPEVQAEINARCTAELDALVQDRLSVEFTTKSPELIRNEVLCENASKIWDRLVKEFQIVR